MASILVLEDEESVNRGIELTLKKEGYTVYGVRTIGEAREILKTKNPELLIFDVNLPDGNSLELIREIREKTAAHIICLTALDQEMDQVIGYEAGADDYVTKPFSLSVLMLKVNAYFKKHVQTAVSCIESGDWSFCPEQLEAKNGDKEVSFTKTEWKMLRLFLDHPKQILSKNQILQQIFDLDGDFVDENTVAVNIRRLREKIEPDAARPEYIRNVRGLGYIWDKECARR
ncbi:response regulator transcription factor [Sellimonas sp.]|uniref:response regulator transcription factor n=1 Tax=Sellimonas sp. TaxID=2021466 RepID=UPI000B39E94D|nr:response regulator transcription factor [Sellimonas sp.]OUP01659.1 DNA-binding response regulator [Drancourtella sp. An210]OUP63286.1 DNA-binding response regulator [Drancourtella sp. An177]